MSGESPREVVAVRKTGSLGNLLDRIRTEAEQSARFEDSTARKEGHRRISSLTPEPPQKRTTSHSRAGHHLVQRGRIAQRAFKPGKQLPQTWRYIRHALVLDAPQRANQGSRTVVAKNSNGAASCPFHLRIKFRPDLLGVTIQSDFPRASGSCGTASFHRKMNPEMSHTLVWNAVISNLLWNNKNPFGTKRQEFECFRAQALGGGTFIAIAPNVDRPVVHWRIRTPVEIITGYDADEKPRMEKKRYLIEGYIEPTCGFMILRSKEMARGQRLSLWYVLQRDDSPALAVHVREKDISNCEALAEAMQRVSDESQEWLTKRAALPLQELPAPEALESTLDLY